MNEYNSIAFNYEDQEDYATASYFYQKVIELAVSCKVVARLVRTNNTSWWGCWVSVNVTIKARRKRKRYRFWKMVSITQVLLKKRNSEWRWSN
jgi:hypothetical protein